MVDTEINLPGEGNLHELFRFDSVNRPVDGPMTLEALLNAGVERWNAPGSIAAISTEYFHGRKSDDYLFLNANVQVTNKDIRAITHFLYDELISALPLFGYPKLLRCWNYVPDINAGEGDEENYRQFCWGRSEALEYHKCAPAAATAVGCEDGWLRISALACSDSVDVRYMENPRQMSAYRYPRKYGPKSPSFARATWFSNAGQEMLLLSGTSSIADHETKHVGDVRAQTEETHRNIISLLDDDVAYDNLRPVSMRYYLRHAAEFDKARQAYQSILRGFPEAVILKSGICRAALSMEIEGVFASPLNNCI